MGLVHVLRAPLRWMRGAYDWMLRFADKPYAEKALFGLSFAEASFFPIPPDPLLLAMGAGKPSKALRFAFVTTLASVCGAVLGYGIGLGLFDTVGVWLLSIYDSGYFDAWDIHTAWEQAGSPDPVDLTALAGSLEADAAAVLAEMELGPTAPAAELTEVLQHESVFLKIKGWYDEMGFVGVLLAAITPIPFKVFTIASGAFGFAFLPFLAASALGRAVRFFAEGLLLKYFGPPIVVWVDKWFNLAALVFAVLLIGGFVLIKYI